MVVELATVGVVVVFVVIVARLLWVRSRRLEAHQSVSEEEAREHAAPLSTAIIRRSRRKQRDP
jgi:hypothetical protein